MTTRELRDTVDTLRQELRGLHARADNRTVRRYFQEASVSLRYAWMHLDRMLEREERKGELASAEPTS